MAVTLSVAGCSTGGPAVPSMKGLATGYGRLVGHVAPGAPPSGTVPDMTLTFSNGSRTVEAVVHSGSYQVDLPAGVWSAHSPAGVCANGISVRAGAWQRDDLGFPMGQCQQLSPPPTPPAPPGSP